MARYNLYFSDADLAQLLSQAAEAGAARVLATLRPDEDLVSQNEAFRIYGRRTVEKWISQGLIIPRRRANAANSKKFVSRAECQALVGSIRIAEIYGKIAAQPREHNTQQQKNQQQ